MNENYAWFISLLSSTPRFAHKKGTSSQYGNLHFYLFFQRAIRSKCSAVIFLVTGMIGMQLVVSRSSPAVEPLSTIIARSCSGIGRPLTKNDIELRGKRLGFPLDSNTMGTAFENFAIESARANKYTGIGIYSPLREYLTQNSSNGVQRRVVPDTLGTFLVLEFDTSLRITYSQPYQESFFREMKFTTGAIQLSAYEHQIIGYIDIAKRSPAGLAPISLGSRRPTPIVEFSTPADASIGLNVITTATKDRVGVFHRVACDAESTPSPTDMILGARQALNPEIFTGAYPIVYEPAGSVAGLRL
jgi:hypothetical protein